MKCKIKNTGQTPVKNKYGKIPSNYTVCFALLCLKWTLQLGKKERRCLSVYWIGALGLKVTAAVDCVADLH